MASASLTLPRSELHALLLRAARGAGVPQSHGEDLARAVAAHGGSRAVSAACRALGRRWRVPGYALDGNTVIFPRARAVECLPVAIDALQADVEAAELADIDEPDLVAPFVAQAARVGRANLAMRASETGVVLEHGREAAPAPRQGRVEVAAEVHDLLSRFAARTYVAATAASRAGAGAGAIDND
ncbi:MAG: hypothetical protein AAFP13_05320 [Pseudomonadota bacterium]